MLVDDQAFSKNDNLVESQNTLPCCKDNDSTKASLIDSKEKIKDPFNLGYFTFFFFGVSMLLPWNSI